MYTVKLTKLIEKMELECVTPEVDYANIRLTQTDVNRPALQLTGFFENFDSERVQVIGNVEYSYMQQLGEEKTIEMVRKIMSFKMPCIVFCRSLPVSEGIKKCAAEAGVPVFSTSKTTSAFMAEVIRWLNVELAPRIAIHGVLVDVYGEGLLIMGESGIGKSEAALELIKRGHRLVADDVVEIKKVSDDTLIGSSPENIRHLIELRGIGIIDVKTLFGVEAVKNTQSINLVIKLEEWHKDKEYDRLGIEEQYTEFLGNKIVCHNIPIRPGRNLAIICESAAVNYRQKKMGYNAAKEFYNRMAGGLMRHNEDDD